MNYMAIVVAAAEGRGTQQPTESMKTGISNECSYQGRRKASIATQQSTEVEKMIFFCVYCVH